MACRRIGRDKRVAGPTPVLVQGETDANGITLRRIDGELKRPIRLNRPAWRARSGPAEPRGLLDLHEPTLRKVEAFPDFLFFTEWSIPSVRDCGLVRGLVHETNIPENRTRSPQFDRRLLRGGSKIHEGDLLSFSPTNGKEAAIAGIKRQRGGFVSRCPNCPRHLAVRHASERDDAFTARNPGLCRGFLQGTDRQGHSIRTEGEGFDRTAIGDLRFIQAAPVTECTGVVPFQAAALSTDDQVSTVRADRQRVDRWAYPCGGWNEVDKGRLALPIPDTNAAVGVSPAHTDQALVGKKGHPSDPSGVFRKRDMVMLFVEDVPNTNGFIFTARREEAAIRRERQTVDRSCVTYIIALLPLTAVRQIKCQVSRWAVIASWKAVDQDSASGSEHTSPSDCQETLTVLAHHRRDRQRIDNTCRPADRRPDRTIEPRLAVAKLPGVHDLVQTSREQVLLVGAERESPQ